MCPCYVHKIDSFQILVIHCKMQIFLMVLALRVFIENYSIPQEAEQGGSEHKQLCPKGVFSGVYVQICPLSQKVPESL